MILAISKTGEVIGAINTDQYQGVESSFPYGWKELIDSGVTFDQVDFDPISTEQADAMLSFYQPMKKVRNFLYSYEGGGYDGCIYECNYAYFDDKGEFWNVYSSGLMGCSTEKEIIERIKEGREIDEIDLNSEDALLHFTDNEGLKEILRCAKFFAENNIDVKIRPKCDCCGERFEAIVGHGNDWHGVGGIQSTPLELICQNCWDMYSCDCCNEFFGKTEVFTSSSERKNMAGNYENVCRSCVTKLTEPPA